MVPAVDLGSVKAPSSLMYLLHDENFSAMVLNTHPHPYSSLPVPTLPSPLLFPVTTRYQEYNTPSQYTPLTPSPNPSPFPPRICLWCDSGAVFTGVVRSLHVVLFRALAAQGNDETIITATVHL